MKPRIIRSSRWGFESEAVYERTRDGERRIGTYEDAAGFTPNNPRLLCPVVAPDTLWNIERRWEWVRERIEKQL